MSRPPGLHGQGELGAIAPILTRRHPFGVGNVEAGDAAQRVTHDGLPGGALGHGAEVLQLAATAGIAVIVGAAGGDPVRSLAPGSTDSRASVASLHFDAVS